VCSQSVGDGSREYLEQSFRNDVALGGRLTELIGADDIRGTFPDAVRTTASFKNRKGYVNHDNGWADAGQGLALMIQKVEALGGKFITGKTVSDLLRENGNNTVGVRCFDGTVYEAALVILALGSWTASALPELGLEKRCLATG
jgi:sarcosine oxidase/L-pipecolate oxidase